MTHLGYQDRREVLCILESSWAVLLFVMITILCHHLILAHNRETHSIFVTSSLSDYPVPENQAIALNSRPGPKTCALICSSW